MTLQGIYDTIKKKIAELGKAAILELKKKDIPEKAFAYLLDLLKQESLKIGGPDITFDEKAKKVTIFMKKDAADIGLDIFGTKSADFKLEITEGEKKFVFVLTATLDNLSINTLADSGLIDKNTPALNELPQLNYGSVSLIASSGDLSLKIKAEKKGANWNVLGLPMFKLQDIAIDFSLKKGGEDTGAEAALAMGGLFAVGSTAVTAAVNIPLSKNEKNEWHLSCSSKTPLQKTFQDISGLLFSNSLQNYVPKEMLAMGSGITLDKLEIDFGIIDLAVKNLEMVVNAKGRMSFANINFTNAEINLTLEPGKAEGSMDLASVITVTIDTPGLPPTLILKVPSINSDWTLETEGKPTPVTMDVVAKIPGSASKDDYKLPAALTAATAALELRSFKSTFAPSIPSWKQVTIDVGYDPEWEFIPGVLKVNKLNLNLDAKKNAKTDKTSTTGKFNADLWAGGAGDKGFPLTLAASKKGDDWNYTATAKDIKLTKIITALLGDPDFSIIPAVNITSIELKIDQTKKFIEGVAKVDTTWQPFDGIKLDASLVAKITSDRIKAPYINTASIEGIIGIEGVSAFKNSKLKLSYSLKGKAPVIKAEFEGITAEYTNNSFTFNLGNLSLGTIITKMVSWFSPNSALTLDDPWSVLNDINLKDLNFNFNLKEKTFGFEYKPGSGINLGFASINGIKLTCKKTGAKYAMKIKLDGQLLGIAIPEWDLMKPETAPKVPGKGDSKFDLEYLAMGQRVAFSKTDDIHKMDTALTKLKNAFKEPEKDDEVPVSSTTDIVFNENSNWLIGARFTIMNTVELGVIFNDPQLYCLLVKLKGDKAKSFKGLEFEIIYKKVSDTVGVFEIELKLPDAMRNLEFGAVSVTLPVIGLQIYTNGNFRIDVGFPWNGDFARSFTVQAFPFIGSGGFYFAWLSAETATSTPAITNGNFSPVIEFGLGMALGLGKTFEKGILSGGLSLMVRGILQGVIGFYNPNPVNGVTVKSDANYYAVQGTLEIVGRLYGNINFAIIKASLDITVNVLAKIIFVSYEPIDIYLEAGISVRLTIEIDLGLFSINVHFSFDATVKEHFQVGERTTPPWQLAQKQPARLVRQKHAHLFRSNRNLSAPVIMNWSPLKFNTQPAINIFFVPSLTVVAKKDNAGVAQQTPRYMTMLYIESGDPDKKGTADASFTTLAKSLLVWAVNSNQSKPWDKDKVIYEEIITETVTLEYLQSCHDYFTSVKDVDIPVDAINQFLTAFKVNVNLYEEKENEEAPHASIFPMFPQLTLKSTLKDEQYSAPVNFETHTPVSPVYREEINSYFEKIAVNYRDPLEAAHNARKLYENKNVMAGNATPSMASVIYQDYFLMMAKAGLSEAIDFMKAFPYAYNNETLAQLNAAFKVNEEVILHSNRSVTLSAGLKLNIDGAYAGVVNDASFPDTLFTISADFEIPVARLIGFNRAKTDIVKAGITVTLESDKTKTFTTIAGTTLQQIADHFKVAGSTTPIADVVSNTDIATQQLFIGGSKLLIEPLEYVVNEGDSIQSVLNQYKSKSTDVGLDIYSFGELNCITEGLFIPKSHIYFQNKPEVHTVTGSDTFLSIAEVFTGGDVRKLMTLIAQSNQVILLQPQATLFIPGFVHTANEERGAKETIDIILSRFPVTLETLLAGNEGIQNIWSQGAVITLPNISQLRIDDLITQLADNDKFKSLSGMAARFLLHGLRLPVAASLKQAKLLTRANWEAQVATQSLYELTGQGLDVPVLNTGDEFSIVLEKNQGAAFINFNVKKKEDGADKAKLRSVNAGDQLVVKLKEEDIARIKQLTGAVLDPEVPLLQAMQPYVETARKFNFSNFTQWAYNAAKPIWPNQQDGVVPTIWQMPSNLLQAAFSPEKVRRPLFKLVTAKQDMPNTPVKIEDVANYSWTLSIPLSIRRVPLSSSADQTEMTPNIYEIMGTDEVSMIFLERLIRFYNTEGSPKTVADKVYILYPPNPADNGAGSLLSNDPEKVTSFIVKTNFSTESNPVFLKTSTEPVKIQSDPRQFAEMVWQASVVKTGGFYLYYAFNEKDELPANLFTNDNKADLKLVFTFNGLPEKGLIYDFMNSVAIGENVNPANAVLCAVSEQQVIGTAKTSSIDAIQGIANNFRISIDELGEALHDAKLSTKVTQVVKLSGLTYEVKPGDTFNSIADYFNKGQQTGFNELIKASNPGLADEAYSKVWTLINLPDIDIYAGTVPAHCYTLASIAAYFHISVSRVTHLVKDIKGLFDANQSYPLTDQLLERSAIMQPGTIGVELKRKKPGSKVAGNAAQPLENTFNLLGLKLAGNKYFNESGESLPAGFNDLEKLKRKRLLKGVQADNLWNYQRVLPVAPFAIANSMKDSGAPDELVNSNPYAGIGGSVQLNMNWQDVFGNRTVDPFSYPDRFKDKTNAPLNLLPVKVAYTDQLISLDKWPGFSANYTFQKDVNDTLLCIVFGFDVSKYVVYKPVNPDEIIDETTGKTSGDKFKDDLVNVLNKTKADHQVYKNIIYQVCQADVSFAVSDTLSKQKWVLIKDQLDQLRKTINTIYSYLDTLIAAKLNYEYYTVTDQDLGENTFATAKKIADAKAVNIDDLISINLGLEHPFLKSDTYQTIIPKPLPAALMLSNKCQAANENQIFELAVDVTIARNSALIDEGFVDAEGVGAIKTILKPVTTNLAYAMGHFDKDMDAAGRQLSLSTFAVAFESAYNNCKIASGTSVGNLLANDKQKQLWVIRWGGSEGIGFDIINEPVYFSTAPLSNYLLNFSGDKAVEIRSFDPAKGLADTGVKKNYAGISLDVWGKRFLEAVDNFLMPQYAIPAFVLDQNYPEDKSLKKIQDAKQVLAKAITSGLNTDRLHSKITNVLDAIYDQNAMDTAAEKLRQSLLIKLGNAYKADTVVWFKTSVTSKYQKTATFIPPNIYGQPLVPGKSTAEQLYSMSAAKIPLAKDSSDMAFIFSTQNKEDEKSLQLELAYQVTHIEFDINPVHVLHPDKKDLNPDYNASTWLSFVIPPVEKRISADNSKINIPVPLKVYPAPPSVTAQEGNPWLVAGADASLRDLLFWDYEYVYEQMGSLSAQDSITTKVQFNIKENNLLKGLPESLMLFANLAQFTEAYPAIEPVLAEKLLPITPLSKEEDMKSARYAVKAFAEIATLVAKSWGKWRLPDQAITATGKTDLVYEITEYKSSDLEESLKDDVLVVKITPVTGDRPSISIDGFKTHPATEYDPKLGDGLVFKDGEDKWLLYAEKSKYSKRKLKLGKLNILAKQNAWASLSKVRNSKLVDDKITTPPFIYRTPDVRFANMMVPYLDTINYQDFKPVDIAKINNPEVGKRPLVDMMQALFATIFNDSGSDDRVKTIKLEVSYSYTLGDSPDSMAITLPVFILPPYNLNLQTDFIVKPGCADNPDGQSFVCLLANRMNSWFKGMEPVTTNARFLVDLSVYNSINQATLPSLRIRDMYLAIRDIS